MLSGVLLLLMGAARLAAAVGDNPAAAGAAGVGDTLAAAATESDDWSRFKQKYNKSYSDEQEDLRRMQIFRQNQQFVERHMAEYSAGRRSFSVALNKFSDLTTEEWSSLYNRLSEKTADFSAGNSGEQGLSEVVREIPETLDWRQEGAVTEVKDQTPACGSCWAFVTTGAVEGAWKLAGNSLVSLSEQQLIDCSWDYGNVGCQGGRMENAYRYLLDNEGVMSEQEYPYQATDNGTCADDVSLLVAHIDSWRSVTPARDEMALQAAVAAGPVATAIDASHASMQHYSGGIYDEPACSDSALDHAVLLVGYGDGYWLVKNSWGADWGMDGYIQMKRDGSNQCGIATDPTRPVVNAA